MEDRKTAVTAATSAVALAKGPSPGTIIAGKYEVESVLGFGGMGLVIAARHLQLDERIAIKLLRDDVELAPDHVERFIREAQAAARLKSEHVARVDDVGTMPDGKPFMVMELLEGLDLGQLLDDTGTLARPLAVDLILQVCDALAEAHANGIVHRDIKPTNLFVTSRRDGSPLVKVLDFGISKAASSDLSLTQTSSVLGTPTYMSPEQMRSARHADARSDLWSLATVLYEMVEGRTPFEASNFAELCVAVATEDPRPLVQAPELASVMALALAKSADARFPSIAELADALAPFTTDPQRANRQVNRIFRLLGKTAPHPGARDSTPTIARAHTFASEEASTIANAAPTIAASLRPRRRWLLPLAFGVLAASAAAAVIVATGSAGDARPAAGSASGSATAWVTVDAPAATVAHGSDATSPAGIASAGSAGFAAATASAGSAGHDDAPTAGSASIHRTPPHHAPARAPVRRPAVRRPPAHEAAVVPAVTSPPPPPPKPKCDPFANPKGCPREGLEPP